MPILFRTADQGTLPLMGLDDELSALRDEVVKLRTHVPTQALTTASVASIARRR